MKLITKYSNLIITDIEIIKKWNGCLKLVDIIKIFIYVKIY